MRIAFKQKITQDLDRAEQLEWIETNGLGGWASSTITGCHSRRYHGLLVAATSPPTGRMVMLSRLDETIEIEAKRFELSVNRFPNTVHPNGNQYLYYFTKQFFPVFEYECGGVRIRKTIVAVHGENTTLVLYEVIQSLAPFVLELRPFIAAREIHSLTHANPDINREAKIERGIFRVRAYDGVPELFMAVPQATYHPQPEWYYNFEYRAEQQRGLDFQEDLFTHGVFRVNLQSGNKLGIIISTKNPVGRDAFELSDTEHYRRFKFCSGLPVQDEFCKTLTLAADQFIVKRGDDLRTIVAGYHWFTDWGRDAMISLPGLCLITGRFDDAKSILRSCAKNVSRGLLPNQFPEDGQKPDYNTVDATLWFFVAAYKYLQYTHDKSFVRDRLLPVLDDIIAWHDRGTHYNIHVDDDGLLYAGTSGVQLTWMDAKIGDWVVTPRQGKAVEINALWYNALMIASEFHRQFGHTADAEQLLHRAQTVRKKFCEKFWYEEGKYLYDYLDGGHADTSIRPNQIFALSLPFPLLEGEKARHVLRIVEEHLATPVGLRSLAPIDPNYRGYCEGDQFSRDSAYHQGTVWSWLIGPYVNAILNVEGSSGKEKVKNIIENIAPHLQEAGLGTISEIFDGETPHSPRGSIAQAWSIAELLRAYVEDVLDVKPPTNKREGN